MSKIKTAVTVLSIVSGVVSGGAVVYDNVIEPIVESNKTVTVVEELNYEYQHVITTTDVYIINGVEVTKEEFEAKKAANDSIKTTTEDSKIEVLDEKAVTIYYGAVDSLPTSLNGLTAASYDVTPASLSATIVADGNPDDGQWVVVVTPNDIGIESWQTSGFNLSYETYDMGDYIVYYLTSPVYDDGLNYKIYFEK